jgi:hypothetical protein
MFFEALENRRLLSFSPAVNYATIGTPSAIVTADLNNDGKLDLVTCANAATGSYSVFLGNGAGGFGAAQRTVIGSQLSTMAVADFNNDNKADLVMSDDYHRFGAFMGNGDGTFQPPIYTESGEVAAVGRFNGDSYADVLVSRLGPDWEIQFQVYCGNGQGGFTAVEPELWYYGSRMTAVDLNNDGKLDAVTAEGYVFPGNGDGTFEFDWEQPALVNGGVIATGDFTGDGNADAIVAGFDHISVLRGRGDGTFDAPITQTLSETPRSGVATADFNGDGKLDAMVSMESSGDVRLMLGNGDGTLRDAGAFATGTSPSGVVVGDFNRDGRPDAAVSNGPSTTRNLSVLLNDGVWAGTKNFTGPSGGTWSTAGNWTPSGVPGASDNVSIAGKSVTLSSSATVAGVSLTGGGALTIAANGNRLLQTSSLAITGGSKLDLKDNDLLVSYTGTSPLGTWNGSAYTGLSGMVQSGRNGGAWNGSGIVTSMNTAGPVRTTLGISQSAASVRIAYAYAGDANLSGIIDGDDFFAIDQGYSTQTGGYARGDFDYNGRTDADDYFIIDSNYNKAQTPLASGPGAELPGQAVFASNERDGAYERLVTSGV